MQTLNEHLLICLMEECAEVQKAASKVLRFTADDIYNGAPNIEYLKKELNDLIGVLTMLQEEGLLANWRNTTESVDKVKRLAKYMMYSRTLGVLDACPN